MVVSSPASITPPPLVGRDRELALLHEHLAAAHGGRGGLVLISGEAGIGKTALASALCRQAADAGAVVFAGHCYDRTETPPYGPWREIGQRVEVLASAAVPPVPRLDGATSQADLFTQARDFFAALAATRPLVLVLEDLHWADRASLDLLRFIARGLDDLPLLLVATYRDEELHRRHPLSGLVPLLVREGPTARLDLRPLDAAAAQSLVRARYDLAERAVHRLADYLIERTEGNPLFLTELLRSLEDEGLLDHLDRPSYAEALARMSVPSLLKQIVDDRLTRLGDETAALLTVAAVVGQEVRLAVWGAVTAMDEETLLIVAERAEAAHLATASHRGDAIRFAHVLIRDVLYEDISSLRRRQLHRKVAEELMALPAPDPDAVASHFQRAGDERAAEWLVRAGERAEDAYALVTAAARYETAFTLLDAQDGDPVERGWLRLLAAVLHRHEDSDRAITWTEEAVQLSAIAGDPSLAARAQALLGLLISYHGDYPDNMVTLAAGLDAIDRLPPGIGATGRREQWLGRFVNRGTLVSVFAGGGRLTEARAQGETFLARFAASGIAPEERGAVADAHNGLADAYAFQGEPELARRSYAAAVAAYHASDNHLPALFKLREELILAVLSYRADDMAERERVAAEAERVTAWLTERGSRADQYLPRYTRVPLLVLEGRWREAREVLDQRDASDLAFFLGVRPFYRGTMARAQGDAVTAWGCVHEPSPVRPETEPGGGICGPLLLPFQRLATGLALDAGDLSAARQWLDLHRRWLDFMDAVLGRAEGEVLEAEWHRAAGDLRRARVLADQGLAHATTPRQPLALISAHRMLGMLDAEAGIRTAAEDHFTQSLALADACRAPYERALTLIAHAELHVATGNQVRARTVLDEARGLCLPMDAMPALASIERLLRRLDGVTNCLPAGLSERELEVLRLMASGLSNSEIADRLFLSPNTIKAHVAHVLAKIGVHNRAAATEFAVRHRIL